MKQIGTAVIVSVIMMGVGYFLHPSFFNLSVEILDLPTNVRLSATDIVTETPFIFAITLGLIPWFYFLLYKWAPLKSMKDGVFSSSLILLGGGIVWWMRIKFIGEQVVQEGLEKGLLGFDYNYLPADQLKFSLFFGMGILIGTLVAFVIMSFIYSAKEKKEVEF